MKTVINDKTGEYELSFSDRRELEEFMNRTGYAYEIKIPDIENNAYQAIRKSVEVSQYAIDGFLVFRFRENGVYVSEEKIPVEYLKNYTRLTLVSLEYLKKVISENKETKNEKR